MRIRVRIRSELSEPIPLASGCSREHKLEGAHEVRQSVTQRNQQVKPCWHECYENNTLKSKTILKKKSEEEMRKSPF